MKRLRRNIGKYIMASVSVLLIAVMTFMCMPETMTAAAEELKKIGEGSEEATQSEVVSEYEPDFSIEGVDNTLEQEEVYIEYEAEHKRGEYEKHFYMSNGTYMSETYAQPIHYLDDDGRYKDIDNTLIEYTDGGVEKIKNQSLYGNCYGEHPLR